jgi:hypothetical protein
MQDAKETLKMSADVVGDLARDRESFRRAVMKKAVEMGSEK